MSGEWPNDVDVDDPILDAAERCFSSQGVVGTTIDAIAKEAGVSRITVYRRIGSRDRLVLLVLLRVTARFLDRLQPLLTLEPNVEEALVVLIRSTVRAFRRNELKLLFASTGRNAPGVAIPGALSPLSAIFGDVVMALSDEFPNQIRSTLEFRDAGDWLVRIIVSLATLERIDRLTEADTDRWIREFVLPGLLAPAK